MSVGNQSHDDWHDIFAEKFIVAVHVMFPREISNQF
jgi:hypothetical protein